MHDVLSAISWLLVIPFSIAVSVFTIEITLGILPTKHLTLGNQQPKTTILMPAHNEALNISTTLKNLLPIVTDKIRILVVADNCNDNTAALVKDMGIDVIERQAPLHRGKGYALAFGQDYLRLNPPECVIILDADCETDPQSVSDLATLAIRSGSPVQAQNLVYSEVMEGPMVQISNFAFWIKNAVRQRGGSRLGGAALLGGTGMAFPWPLFEKLPLATSSIVEDLGLGIYLTKAGYPPVYLDQALVLSKAADESETINQRSRWEIGFLSMAREYGLKSLWEGLLRSDRKLFQLGLHLIVPPIALLFSTALPTLAFITLISISTNNIAPSILLSGLLIIAVFCILIAWAVGGRRVLSGRTVFRIPLYVMWKIPIYLRVLRREIPEWKRTERKNDTDF
jgi:cellulose synthase/poly-beta-1,6-N-acetylglucosamine synthase-like glycosyltransferase